jgi:hypothetical protein
MRGHAHAALLVMVFALGACSSGGEGETLTLPVSDDFAGECAPWPTGEKEGFSFGCSEGAYDLALKKTGAFHVTEGVRPSLPGISLEADVSVVSGEGRTKGALLGLGCLVDDSHGYILYIKTDTSGWAIARINEDGALAAIALEETSENLLSFPQKVRLRAECFTGSSGSTSLQLFADDKTLGSVVDEEGLGPFEEVALYVQTFPGVVRFDNFKADQIG